ncbi:MAG: hypothetical protein HUU46_13555 [Candidatus Hydrogenedentes bacterium]|nr:hypothetical protein [Candidatus Hydrogenedentota bacterium]
MPCLFVLIAVIAPRLALFLMWLLAYMAPAFETRIWPILGFFFMPYTTCAYAIGMNETGGFQGWSLLLLIVGVVFDLGSHGGSARTTRRVDIYRHD